MKKKFYCSRGHNSRVYKRMKKVREIIPKTEKGCERKRQMLPFAFGNRDIFMTGSDTVVNARVNTYDGVIWAEGSIFVYIAHVYQAGAYL